MKARAKVIVSYTIMGAVHKPCLRPSTQQVIQKNWASTSTKIGIVVSCSTWKVQCIIVQKFNVEGIDTYSYTVVLGKKRPTSREHLVPTCSLIFCLWSKFTQMSVHLRVSPVFFVHWFKHEEHSCHVSSNLTPSNKNNKAQRRQWQLQSLILMPHNVHSKW